MRFATLPLLLVLAASLAAADSAPAPAPAASAKAAAASQPVAEVVVPADHLKGLSRLARQGLIAQAMRLRADEIITVGEAIQVMDAATPDASNLCRVQPAAMRQAILRARQGLAAVIEKMTPAEIAGAAEVIRVAEESLTTAAVAAAPAPAPAK